MNSPVLRLQNVTHRYRDFTALRDLSFELSAGETFGLIGPDGAGKTTALRLALGLLKPTAGEISVFGVAPSVHRRQLSRRVGYLSQRFSIYGDLSVDENVAFFAQAHDTRNWKPRREHLLDRLDLRRFRGRLADRLSGGMKQKLALACTLVHTPQLLVLDEPTTGVDPVSRREFWRILAGLQSEGLTLLVTTPYLDEAERCHRVALLEHGELLVVDEPTRIRASLRGSMLELLAHPRREAQLALRALPQVGDIEAFGERIHVSLPDTPAADAGAVAQGVANSLGAVGIEVRSIRPIQPSLEDVFIAKLRTRANSEGRGGALLALLLALVLLLPGSATAAPWQREVAANAQSDSLRLTLADALQRGIAASPQLDQLTALHVAALGTTKEAKSARFPQLGATAGYARLSEEEEFSIVSPSGVVALNPQIPDRWRMRLGFSWPIFTAGQTSRRVEAAEQSASAAQFDVKRGRNDLELEIAQAYWQLVAERQRVHVLSEALRNFDAHLADAQHRGDVGVATRNELLAVQVERDRAELTLLEAQNRAATAMENLQRLLGETRPIDPVETLQSGSDVPAPSPLQQLQDAALALRPEREALRRRIAAAEALRRAERAGYLPQLSLIGGLDHNRPNARLIPPTDRWEDSWEAGVQLNWSLFDGGRIAGASARAHGTALALSAQLRDFEAQVRMQVAASARALETARLGVRLASHAVDAALENLVVSRNLYTEGMLVSSELLDAETNLLRAQLDRTESQARQRVAEAALAHSVGAAQP